ncbi:MAG: transglutaminase family protein [Bacteroidales bacterium]|nr:transglutaminase family protein [Bacteroidales bacterium]
MIKEKEIQALIALLDDPDTEVFDTVTKSLLEHGGDAIPELEKAWESTLNEKMQERIEVLIQRIQLNSTQVELRSWLEGGATDLLEGVFYIAKYQYPDLKIEPLNEEIEKIKKDVWLELNEKLTALEKVKILNHILFDIYKFSRNRTNFYAPQNNYINTVLETKKGNPISLSVIYILVSQRLEIPVYGVNLPRNFILVFMDELRSEETRDKELEEHILFYINPYNKGAVLGKKEIDYFIMQQKLKPQRSFYVPCTNVEIIQRLILNLIFSYEKLGYPDKIKSFQELFKIVK